MKSPFREKHRLLKWSQPTVFFKVHHLETRLGCYIVTIQKDVFFYVSLKGYYIYNARLFVSRQAERCKSRPPSPQMVQFPPRHLSLVLTSCLP